MKAYHEHTLKAHKLAEQTMIVMREAYCDSVKAHPVLAVTLLDIISAQAKVTADLDALVAALGYEVEK